MLLFKSPQAIQNYWSNLLNLGSKYTFLSEWLPFGVTAFCRFNLELTNTGELFSMKLFGPNPVLCFWCTNDSPPPCFFKNKGGCFSSCLFAYFRLRLGLSRRVRKEVSIGPRRVGTPYRRLHGVMKEVWLGPRSVRYPCMG